MSDIDILKTGICPFTGEKYRCGACEITPPLPEGSYQAEMCMSVSGPLERNKSERDWNKFARGFTDGNGCPQTGAQVRDYFKYLQVLGADVMPMGERCDRFCYKHGCRGHKIEQEKVGVK